MERRRLALLLCALLLAACGTNPVPSTNPATPGESGAVDPSADPSHSPSRSEVGLVVRLEADNDERGVGRRLVDYLTDGTVVRANGDRLEANTLTAEGLADLRSVLAEDANLTSGPATVEPVAKPGAVLTGHHRTYTFVFGADNGARYAVTGPDAASPDAASWAPDPRIDRLNTLAERLLDPPAAGLANAAWTAWNPERIAVFAVFSEVDPFVAENGAIPDLATIGWPFAGDPGSLGTPFEGPNGTSQRCALLPASEVRTALATFETVGGGAAAAMLDAGRTWRSSAMLWSAKSPTTSLSVALMPVFPADATASCEDVLTR